MKHPSLKYFLPSPYDLKLKIYTSKLKVIEIKTETPKYKGLECLFYFADNPCEKEHAEFITSILKKLSETIKSSVSVNLETLKPIFLS
jgi:hypothetical protein